MASDPQEYEQYRGMVTHSLMFLPIYIYKLAERPPKDDNKSKSDISGNTHITSKTTKTVEGREMGVHITK